MSSDYQSRSVPLSQRSKVRRDAKPVDVTCPVCGKTEQLLASVAKVRKTCGEKTCTADLKRRNAKGQAGSIRKRFESKFVKRESGCWEWIGSKGKHGYGVMVVDGKSLRANRLAFKVYNKPLSEEQLACHHCDNPSCVNPDHLYAGTGLTNAYDRISRGRSASHVGELNELSKLTDDAVIYIRNAWRKERVRQSDLAQMFDVSPSLISKVVNHHVWGHVKDEK